MIAWLQIDECMAQALVNQYSGIATFEDRLLCISRATARVSLGKCKSAQCVCVAIRCLPQHHDTAELIHLDRADIGIHHRRCDISAISPPIGQIPWSLLGPTDHPPIILVYTPQRSPHMAVAASAALWLVAPLVKSAHYVGFNIDFLLSLSNFCDLTKIK